MLGYIAVSVLTPFVALLLMRLSPVADRTARASHAILRAIAGRPALTASVVGIFWGAWLAFVSARDGRMLIPRSHDERSYLLQARIFASGRAWLPTPAASEFFDTFHVLVRPVYASKYPPGTAMLHAPALALGLPWWTTAFAMAIVAFALIAYVGIRLAGPWAIPVLLAAAMTSAAFQMDSLAPLSQPALLVPVYAAWALCVRVRVRPRVRWFAVAGALAGVAVLIRPIDAVVLLAAPAVGFVRFASRGLGARRTLVGVVVGLIACGLFVAGLLCFDRGVAGSFTKAPWTLYAEQYQPGEHVGFANGGTVASLPPGLPPQKYDFYEQHEKPVIEGHTLAYAFQSWIEPMGRGTLLLIVLAGPTLMIAALPLAVVGLRRRRLVAVGATILANLGLYTVYAFGGSNYYMPIAPLVWIAAAAGVNSILRRTPAPSRHALAGGVMLCLFLLVTCLHLPFSRAIVGARTSEWPFQELSYVERDAMPLVHAPAVVLFRYSPSVSYHVEPVYNLDAADPLASPVIRAHWLGPERDRVLFEAMRDRGRGADAVYIYDRASGRLFNLGTVEAQLAKSATRAASEPASPARR